MDYWKTTLRGAKFVVAPMVDQSELAWRLLSRKHGAQLCYTPMFHAVNFVNDPTYRRDNFQTCSKDRPLIVQFCANDPETLVKACQFVEAECDGVDLNLGCPQSIAKRGRYGAFLQDDWPLILELVSAVHRRVKVPISCKIRIFDDEQKTVEYARMIEKAGCQLLVVHGRTRDQKGRNTGLADWKQIRAVKKALKIPVFANGNIQYYEDVLRCLQETGVDGVMTAEGNLHHPFIFEKRATLPACWEPALEYLDLVDQFPCNMSFVRGHLFKLLHFCLLQHPDLRENLATSCCASDCRSVVLELKCKCQASHEAYLNERAECVDAEKSAENKFCWLCRPYVRPSLDTDSTENRIPLNGVACNLDQETCAITLQIKAVKRKHQEEIDRLTELYGVSKNRAKKLAKFPNKQAAALEPRKLGYNKCLCGNPLSSKCPFNRCKLCCRSQPDVNECENLRQAHCHFRMTGETQRTVNPVNTGSSVIAVEFDGGVAIAADTLASFGSMARFGKVSRLYEANSRTMLGMSGDYADFQYLRNAIEAKIMESKRLDFAYEFNPSAIYSWLSVVLYNRRSKGDPLFNSYIVAGVNKLGKEFKPFLGTINKLGVTYENPFIATGVGGYFVTQTLENEYEKAAKKVNGAALSKEAAIALLKDCLEILYYRDGRAHYRFEIGIVTSEGTKIFEPAEIVGNWEIAQRDCQYFH